MSIPFVHVFFVAAAEFVYGRKLSSWWRGTLILILIVYVDTDSGRSTSGIYVNRKKWGQGCDERLADSKHPRRTSKKRKEECFRCFSLEGNFLKEGRNDAQTDDMDNDVIAKRHTYSLLDPRINTQGEKYCG